MKAEDIVGSNVVDLAQGDTVGKASGFLIDADEKRVVAVAVSGGRFLARPKYVRLTDVASIEHEVLMIPSADALVDRKDILVDGTIESLTGKKIITEDGRELGDVHGYELDPNTGDIESITLGVGREGARGLWRSGDVYIIPRSLMRTLGENVIVERSTPEVVGMKQAA